MLLTNFVMVESSGLETLKSLLEFNVFENSIKSFEFSKTHLLSIIQFLLFLRSLFHVRAGSDRIPVQSKYFSSIYVLLQDIPFVAPNSMKYFGKSLSAISLITKRSCAYCDLDKGK